VKLKYGGGNRPARTCGCKDPIPAGTRPIPIAVATKQHFSSPPTVSPDCRREVE